MDSYLTKRWLPIIIWLLIIFLASSNSMAGLYKILTSWALIGIPLYQLLIPLVHLAVFFILTFFLARALNWRKNLSLLALLLAFLTSIFFTVAAEIYQNRIPGRGFDWDDLFMSGIGALLGVLGYVLWYIIIMRKKEKDNLLI